MCCYLCAAFLKCTLQHKDYYEPFLDMLDGIQEGKDDNNGKGDSKGDDVGTGKGTSQSHASKGNDVS